MKKKKTKTKTLEFDIDGIEEAYSPAPGWKTNKQAERKLEVDRPPEIVAFEPRPNVWIAERRGQGLWAGIRRWLTEKSPRKKTAKRNRRSGVRKK
jgi:hypothetical protein